MKPTIEQIDKAIYWCKHGFYSDYNDDIMLALRVLKKLMEEPSADMWGEIRKSIVSADDVSDIFKAMRDQLLREVEND